MLAALRDWMRNANRHTAAAAARALIDLVERRGDELDEAGLDLIADALTLILYDVADDMRPSLAGRLRAARAPRAPDRGADDARSDAPDARLAQAREADGETLLALSAAPRLGRDLTHVLAARGGRAAQIALLANPEADLSASTLAMLAELAISDLALKRALVARRDLPPAIRAAIAPYLSPDDRAVAERALLS